MTNAIDDAGPNRDQATSWNEQAGPRWVANERALDGQLEPFGVAVATKMKLAAGARVLDVGCGAGATSLMLADRVRPGQVVGVDISAPLVTRARERAKGRSDVRFELGDAQTFAFDRDSFDAVFSRFGVMFFADPVAAFRNVRAALKRGGEIGFVCWRAMRENPTFFLPLDAALPLMPEPPPAPPPGAPGPFAFEDGDRVRRILDDAGYEDVNVAKHDTTIAFAGRSDLEGAVDLAFQIGPLSRALPKLASGARDEEAITRMRAAVRDALAPHHGPEGVILPAATWIVTARRGS